MKRISNDETFQAKLLAAVSAGSETNAEVANDQTEVPGTPSGFAVSPEDLSKIDALMSAKASEANIPDAVNPNAIAPSEVKRRTSIPLRKIGNKQYFTIYKNKEYRLTGARILEVDRGSNNTELYLVHPGVPIPTSLKRSVRSASIYVAKTISDDVYLICVMQSSTSWYESALEMVRLAAKGFIKVEANSQNCAYDYYEPVVPIPPATWSDLPARNELLALAFRNRVIDKADHPVLRELQGDTRVSGSDDGFDD